MNKDIRVRVVNKRLASFRRAGITFTATPKVIGAGELTEVQLTELLNEPVLSVEEVANTAPPVSARLTLADAVGKLDVSNSGLWTADKKPKASALEALVGRAVTASERDEAFSLYQTYLQEDGTEEYQATGGNTDVGE